MAFTAGDYTAIADAYNPILASFIKLSRNPNVYKRWNEDMTVFNGLAGSQSLSMPEEFLNPRSEKDVKLHWLAACGEEIIADCNEDCSFAEAPEGGADSITYNQGTCFGTSFKVVDQNKLDLSDFAEKAALELANRLFLMDRDLEKKQITALLANVDNLSGIDTNSLDVGSIDSGGLKWNIGSTYNSDTFLYKLEMVVEDLKMIDPVIIFGNAFRFEEKQLLGKTGFGCCDNRDALLKAKFPIIRNFRHVDSLSGADGTESIYLVDRAAVGYFNQYLYKNTVPEKTSFDRGDNWWAYSVGSTRQLWMNGTSTMPVRYDIRFQSHCVDRTEKAMTWEIFHKGAFIKAPEGCDAEAEVVRIEIS